MDTIQPTNKVVMLHGIHQRHWIMKPMGFQLKKAGFEPLMFDYWSLINNLEQHSQRLNEFLSKRLIEGESCHFVVHSLGGLVLRDFLYRYPSWYEQSRIAHCVTLGTPHNGSVTADYAHKLVPLAVKKAYPAGLDGETHPLPDGISLGVIAGNKSRGLGNALLMYHSLSQNIERNQRAHDGTVYVTETMLPNASDHIVLPTSHTGMLLDKQVTEQTIHFLKHGQFNR